FKAGLFCKCLHFINVVAYFILLNLYIPVTCIGMVWNNAQSEQRIVLTNEIQRLVTYLFKCDVLHHQMIRGSADQTPVGVNAFKLIRDVSNAWSGIFAGRLPQNIFVKRFGQLFFYNGYIFFRSNDEYIFFWNKIGKAVKGFLYQRFTRI